MNPLSLLEVPRCFTLESTNVRDMTSYLTQIELAKWLVVELPSLLRVIYPPNHFLGDALTTSERRDANTDSGVRGHRLQIR